MWVYERRMLYPVTITKKDDGLAKYIREQLFACPYELTASLTYITQRYLAGYREISGLLTDIGREAVI